MSLSDGTGASFEGSRLAPWLRARSLAERATDVRGSVTGEERLGRWRQEFPDEDALARRLHCAGLEPRHLVHILAAQPQPAAEAMPAWWRCAMAAYPPEGRSPLGDKSLELDAQIGTGCVRLVAPLLRRARHALTRHGDDLVSAHAKLPFIPETIAGQLVKPLGLELASLCVPAVALELTAARLGGTLPGADAQERAATFLRDLGRAERARELFADNPVLLRLLHDRLRLGTEAAAELLSRLAADWPRLTGELLGPEPGDIVGLEWLGDPHEGGRRVTRLDFAGGARIVYKARSTAADAAYQELLRWAERHGEPLSRRMALIQDVDDRYGWQEWVAPAGCQTSAQVDRFFRRLGGQLALLHALRATDLHHENIIAAGEYPVVVDLECLLHPRLGGPRSETVDPLIAETGMDCVLRVGLLPRADAFLGVDMSGLGLGSASAAVGMAHGVVDDGTDEARLGMVAGESGPGANAVRLGDKPVPPHRHAAAVESGFSSVYGLLRRHADELVASDGALTALASAPTRVVMRFSKAYADVLRAQISDPSALDDGLAREEALNVLWRGVRRRPDLFHVAGAELHDLWYGDVPRFTGRPGSGDLHHHAAGRLDGALTPHTVESVECVRRLDDRDLERQLGLIRASLLAAADLPAARHHAPAPARAADPGALLEGARAAARRLAALALHDGGQAGWLAPTAVDGRPGRLLQAAGPGLGAGQAGIVLFLARFAVAAGDTETHVLTRAALARLLAQTEGATEEQGHGLWTGTGGALWALAHLPDALRARGVLQRGVDLGMRAVRQARREQPLDLRDGLAGWTAGVAALARRTADPRLLTECRRCADVLSASPRDRSGGMLGGPGIGLLLMRLGDLLEDTVLLTEGAGRVRDAGRAEAEDGSWATGAAGTATALASLRRRGGQRRADDDAALRGAVAATLRLGFGRDHTLATGDPGALCAIASAAEALHDTRMLDDVQRRATATLRAGARTCGPDGVEEPGLLTGVAGAGWAWLRLVSARP